MASKMIWLDLEMTGLDEKKHSILEVAALVTNYRLEAIESFHRIVFQPPEALALMDEWCTKTHGASGLTAKIPTGTPLPVVEKELVALIEKHFSKDAKPVLAGNSIWNDRRFIDAQLPEFSRRLHYRMIDVSSFKEIFRECFGQKYEKANAHRAVDDIHESIAELKSYLSAVQLPWVR